jgi:hypothetical protein
MRKVRKSQVPLIGRFLAVLLLLPAAAVEAEPPATVAVRFARHMVRPVLAEGLADRATRRAVTGGRAVDERAARSGVGARAVGATDARAGRAGARAGWGSRERGWGG